MKNRKICLVLSVVLILFIPALQGAAPSAPAPSFPTIKFEKYKLPNGLEVILSEDHRLPLVAVDVWYHVGPANERPGRTGFAHLFEHMMFQGSKHVKANEHFKYLEAAGATMINGTTEFDRTNYFETLPSNQLELGLWLESDRMGWLLDNLTARNLANQRDVVRNERRQGEAQPYDLPEEELIHNLVPKGHPYYGNVIGSHADVEAAELNDVREFHELYYKPNNATLVVAGDYDPKSIKALVEKYFGPIPSGPPVPKIDAPIPPITSERRVTVPDEVELPRLYLAWLTPPIFQPGDVEANLLARILGGGKSSRLYKRLVFDQQIAQDVSAYNYSLMLGSSLTISVTAKPGIKLEQLEKEVTAEIAALQQQGPMPDEIERARNTAEHELIEPLERLGGFGGIADRLDYYNHYTGDPGYLAKDLARYESATAESVKGFAAKLTPESRVVLYAVPGKKVIDDVPKREDAAAKAPAPEPAPDKPEEAWRAHPPKPGPASTLKLPPPEVFKLQNGLTAMLFEQHRLPTLTAELVVLSGSEANPPDRAGLAGFTASMLQEGSEKRTALQVADDVAKAGASLETDSTADFSEISLSALTRNSDATFELLSDIGLHPAFRDAELDRVRHLRLTDILQQHDDPYVLASKFLYLNLYGPKHPYAYLQTGTEESTEATTKDDLVKFYKAGYGPKSSALVIAGDVTLAQAKAMAEKYFGGWTGAAAPGKPPEVSSTLKRHVVIVDRPGANQTMVRVGQIGVARNTPDYASLEVMNASLGGLFSSRINLNLREKNGYTYGAFSRFIYRRGTGPFYIGGAIRTDVTAPAISEIFKEVDRMRSAPVTPEELALAKDSIARSLVGEFESMGQVAYNEASLFVYGLPDDYFSKLPGKIDSVTTADVDRVAKKYLDPNAMLVIAVGDRAKIAPEIQKLNLGTIEAYDVAGKPLEETKAAGAK
jgi:zinc protease